MAKCCRVCSCVRRGRLASCSARRLYGPLGSRPARASGLVAAVGGGPGHGACSQPRVAAAQAACGVQLVCLISSHCSQLAFSLATFGVLASSVDRRRRTGLAAVCGAWRVAGHVHAGGRVCACTCALHLCTCATQTGVYANTDLYSMRYAHGWSPRPPRRRRMSSSLRGMGFSSSNSIQLPSPCFTYAT